MTPTDLPPKSMRWFDWLAIALCLAVGVAVVLI